MRVLFMLSSLAMGGSERVLVSVLPYFKAEGITPVLGTLNHRRDSSLRDAFENSGIRRIDFGAKRMIDRQAWQRFVAIQRQEQFDLVHSQDQDTQIYGALLRRRHNVPLVMTRHVLQEPTPTVKTSLRARLVLLAARYGADRIVAVSEAVRVLFAKQAHIPLSRIDTVYNGIDIERFALKSGREVLGWDPAQRVIIMVGVLREGKGHDVLFQAIPQLMAAVPNVQIKLVGDGELDTPLRKQAEQFGATVEFLGQRTDIPQLLSGSNILVLPSWSEALPTVLIEAGAASLPVVATRVGGSPEIVEDGRTGYLVPTGDPAALAARLIELLQNPELANHMGDEAHSRIVKTFSLQRQAQQTIALYERVLSQNTSGRRG